MEQNYERLLNDIEILLIEDNFDDAELVIHTFKKNNVGNNLIHLTNGAEALDFLFNRGRFSERKSEKKRQVILLDLNLPKIDGLQVLRVIKDDERTRNIPVIIMTSSSEANNIIESYQLGVNSYIVKPVNFTDFAKVVSELGFYWVLLDRIPK